MVTSWRLWLCAPSCCPMCLAGRLWWHPIGMAWLRGSCTSCHQRCLLLPFPGSVFRPINFRLCLCSPSSSCCLAPYYCTCWHAYLQPLSPLQEAPDSPEEAAALLEEEAQHQRGSMFSRLISQMFDQSSWAQDPHWHTGTAGETTYASRVALLARHVHACSHAAGLPRACCTHRLPAEFIPCCRV